MIKELVFCVHLASSSYSIPENVIWSILDVEGGKVGVCNKNTNGTSDCGPMQINTIWVDGLARELNKTPEYIKSKLTNDMCFNVAVGTRILKKHFIRTKDLKLAVGIYHSRTPKYRDRYIVKVFKAMARRKKNIRVGQGR